MPVIEVTAPYKALNQETRDILMKQLTDTLLKWEGAPEGNAVANAIAWAYYYETPAGLFYVGGENPSEPRFRIKISTPEIAAIVEDVIGAPAAGFNHWVILREIADGSWGSGGQVFRAADIRSLVENAGAA